MHGFKAAKNKRNLPNCYCISSIFAFQSMMRRWLRGSMLASHVKGSKIKSGCHHNFFTLFQIKTHTCNLFHFKGGIFCSYNLKTTSFSLEFVLQTLVFLENLTKFRKWYSLGKKEFINKFKFWREVFSTSSVLDHLRPKLSPLPFWPPTHLKHENINSWWNCFCKISKDLLNLWLR